MQIKPQQNSPVGGPYVFEVYKAPWERTYSAYKINLPLYVFLAQTFPERKFIKIRQSRNSSRKIATDTTGYTIRFVIYQTDQIKPRNEIKCMYGCPSNVYKQMTKE